ncbi:unnamed protein product [Rhizoctonia solani]|uniref:Uncharacterized protein n=1 Tax=Rhizoctonia solani TaxID=456999 RepID=A0A8H3D9S3_9AGAM|nr:unnamed protein product [Rhizoctonia solani]
MRSDPIPGRTVYTKSARFAHCTALTFSIILSLLDLSYPDVEGRPVHLRIFISAQSLLSYLPESANEDTTIVPWDVWGKGATRWFLCDKATSYWVYWTSGSRFIKVDENPDSVLHDLSVFEFHPPKVRRHALSYTYSSSEQGSQYKEKMNEIVLEGSGLTRPHPVTSLLDTDLPPLLADTVGSDMPTIIETGFSTPVESRLPYRVVTTDLPPLLADTVGSDMPTIIETGFSTPVESRLPYRVVTRPKFVPWCEDWSIDGDHIIGTTVSAYNINHDSGYEESSPVPSSRCDATSIDSRYIRYEPRLG